MCCQVRLWAAMRTQSVAKTVVGALQCASWAPRDTTAEDLKLSLEIGNACDDDMGM
jgi:hypothetical protein